MTQGARVLLAIADATLREALTEQLRAESDLDPVAAPDGEALRAALDDGASDLVLLCSPGHPDGAELWDTLREAGRRQPVVMLGEAPEPTMGSGDGAAEILPDAVVTRPFSMTTLLAVMRSLIRDGRDSDSLLGPYTFKPGARLLIDRAGRRRIRLTEMETTILRCLIRAGRRPIPRERLLNQIWGYDTRITTHTLETHIYRLRQKIERDPSHAAIIVTEPGGYRLVS